MYHDSNAFWKKLLSEGLSEDQWQWDWTSLGATQGTQFKAGHPEKKAKAIIVAKSAGIWAGDGLVQAALSLSEQLGWALKIKSFVQDGKKFKKGDTLLEMDGSARWILAIERPFLNLCAYVGGIATRTSAVVASVRKAWKSRDQEPPRVTSTRKILPHYRDLAIYGVRAGGGYSHRVSLSGGVLIKENHISVAGGIAQAVQGAHLHAPHLLSIEVEVRSLDELKEALDAGANGVLLDNFSPKQVASAVSWISKMGRPVFVEVSGGITEANASKYALPGVHVLSSGSLTHSVPSLDLSLLVKS